MSKHTPRRGAKPGGLSPRLLLLHPAVIVATIWAIAAIAWYSAPEDVLATAVSGERAGSLRGAAFIAGVTAAVMAGSVAVSLGLRARTLPEPSPEQRRRFAQVATIVAVAAVAGGLVWLARITSLAGGPLGLWSLFSSGRSVVELKATVYTPAELPPLTTLVHLSPAAASMLLLRRRFEGWTSTSAFLLAALVLIAGVRTIVLAERLAGLGLLAAIAVTLILTAPQLPLRRIALWGAAGVAAVWVAWSAGEFSRSWIYSRPGSSGEVSLANFTSSLSYSQTRLHAYLFTAINNGLIIIDEWERQEFPANFAPALGRAGLPGLPDGSASRRLYESDLSAEFTGESLSGKLFLDARELGVVLALAYGVAFGLAWRAAVAGSPAGVVLYAGLSIVLIDSYRTALLLDLQGLSAMAAAAMALVAWHGAGRVRARRTAFARAGA